MSDTYAINLSGDALDDLRARAESEGIDVTEYVRRAIGLRAFFQDQIRTNGSEVLLRNNTAGKIEKVDVLK